MLKGLAKPTTDELYKFSMGFCDAVVKGSPKLSKGLEAAIKSEGKPTLAYSSGTELIDAHAEFYGTVLEAALV